MSWCVSQSQESEIQQLSLYLSNLLCMFINLSIDLVNCRFLGIVSEFVFWGPFTASNMVWTPVHY